MELNICRELLCLILIFILWSCPVLSENRTIAIVVPSTNQKTSNVYEIIIEGITQKTPQFKKKIFRLTDENRGEVKNGLLLNKSLIAIVTIGNYTSDFVNSFQIKTPIITTGVLFSEDNIQQKGVFLSMDEGAIKKKIRRYLPHIKKIYMGDEAHNIIWFSDIEIYSLPLIQRKKIGSDQKSIVNYLWDAISHADPATEAVWINSKIEHMFLYDLSELAWNKNVALLSNNISHLESGVLLAFYPEFNRIGKRAGEIINRIYDNNHISLREPLRTINSGINLRTAKHLGIPITPASEKEFGVIIK